MHTTHTTHTKHARTHARTHANTRTHTQVTPVTIKALRVFLNAEWEIAGFRAEKLTVRGIIPRGFDSSRNRGTVKALQSFLNFK